jgi:hypothetical protein
MTLVGLLYMSVKPDGITRDVHVVDDVAHAMQAAAMPVRDEVALAAARLTFEDTVRQRICVL